MSFWQRLNWERYHIRLTIEETDSKLSRWMQVLNQNRYIELGDDAELVQHIENDLQDATLRLHQLSNSLGLSRLPLGKANYYYAATKQLEDTSQLLSVIKDKDFGSRQNTRQCIAQLQECIHCVRELNQFVPENILPS